MARDDPNQAKLARKAKQGTVVFDVFVLFWVFLGVCLFDVFKCLFGFEKGFLFVPFLLLNLVLAR